MKEVLALMRVSWLSAASYRVGMVISLLSFLIAFVPTFFVAEALQPIVAESISGESQQYFSFLIVGMGMFVVISAAATTLPSALGGSIGSGTLEALLVTPAPMYRIVIGMSAYNLLWSLLRAFLMLVAAAVIGVHMNVAAIPLVLLILTLLTASYFSVALVASAFVLMFRTSGPLIPAVLTVSSLLGGVYYATGVIPSWIQKLSALVPLTYGLRSIRQLLLLDAGLPQVIGDITVLLIISVLLLLAGGWTFVYAMRHSRKAGTLTQY